MGKVIFLRKVSIERVRRRDVYRNYTGGRLCRNLLPHMSQGRGII